MALDRRTEQGRPGQLARTEMELRLERQGSLPGHPENHLVRTQGRTSGQELQPPAGLALHDFRAQRLHRVVLAEPRPGHIPAGGGAHHALLGGDLHGPLRTRQQQPHLVVEQQHRPALLLRREAVQPGVSVLPGRNLPVLGLARTLQGQFHRERRPGMAEPVHPGQDLLATLGQQGQGREGDQGQTHQRRP